MACTDSFTFTIHTLYRTKTTQLYFTTTIVASAPIPPPLPLPLPPTLHLPASKAVGQLRTTLQCLKLRLPYKQPTWPRLIPQC